ncbi:unnamed protein product [Cuscuta europaea]|uniref:Uncharacterized protein n=1 Tax=Cuscuta europaea TaxID=41803 RepID=A0A9P0ZYV4_CUSEU|nr:unnamed protein product [Cuscuta europaea]
MGCTNNIPPILDRSDKEKGKMTVEAGHFVTRSRVRADAEAERLHKKSRHDDASKVVVLVDVSDDETNIPSEQNAAHPPLKSEINNLTSGLIEFSRVRPHAESRMLFGQTASSIWCILISPHMRSLRTCSRAAYEWQGRVVVKLKVESNDLLKNAKGWVARLQKKADTAHKLVRENASLQEKLKGRDGELQMLRAQLAVAESAGVAVHRVGAHGATLAYVSKIKTTGSTEFQRSTAFRNALQIAAKKQFLRFIVEHLAQCEDPYLGSIDLLKGSREG